MGWTGQTGVRQGRRAWQSSSVAAEVCVGAMETESVPALPGIEEAVGERTKACLQTALLGICVIIEPPTPPPPQKATTHVHPEIPSGNYGTPLPPHRILPPTPTPRGDTYYSRR